MRITCVLVAAALGLAGCSSAASGGGGPALPPVGESSPGSPAPPPSSATADPSGAAPASPTLLHGLQNLTVTDDVRSALVTAYVAENSYDPAWIAGTRRGTVYYARDPATGDTDAQASFDVAPGAPEKVLVGMQDAGVVSDFIRHGGTGAWQPYDICSTPAFLALVGGRLPAGRRC